MTERMPTAEEMLEPTADGLSKLARHVLGMDYWIDEKTGKMKRRTNFIIDGSAYHTCGLVNWGPHREMLQGMADDSSGSVIIMASRGGLKTSAVQAAIIQSILRDPDICIMVYMETRQQAVEMVRTVKSQFEQNLKLREVFGDWVPKKAKAKDGDDPTATFAWTDSKLTVGRRKNLSDKNPTLAAAGTDVTITGGHYHKIFIDDPTSWQQAMSVDQMKKAVRGYEQLVPILNPGGRFVVTCTPYDELDLSHHIRNEVAEDFRQIILDCGMRAVSDGKGGFSLEGEPRFPHHNKDFLAKQLRKMGPQQFNSQYALLTTNPADQVFYRDQFVEVPWHDRMSQMSCYVMTDSAASDLDTACYGVAAMVALDHHDVAYLLDLRVGRWKPQEFSTELLDMVAEWQSKVKIVGVTAENIGLNRVYRAFITREAQERNMRLNFIGIPRGIADGSKTQRIQSLQSRFAAGHFRVVNTCSTHYFDQGEAKVLWNPQGFKDEEGNLLPGGELVEEFLRFRIGSKKQTGKVDICDALADLQACDPRGKRFVAPSPKPWRDADAGAVRGTPQGPAGWDKREQIMRRGEIFGAGKTRPTNFWSRMASKVRSG